MHSRKCLWENAVRFGKWGRESGSLSASSDTTGTTILLPDLIDAHDGRRPLQHGLYPDQFVTVS